MEVLKPATPNYRGRGQPSASSGSTLWQWLSELVSAPKPRYREKPPKPDKPGKPDKPDRPDNPGDSPGRRSAE